MSADPNEFREPIKLDQAAAKRLIQIAFEAATIIHEQQRTPKYEKGGIEHSNRGSEWVVDMPKHHISETHTEQSF